MKNTTYHDLLDEEFGRRKQFNAAYSLRAFARDLGISVEAVEGPARKLKLSEKRKNGFAAQLVHYMQEVLKRKTSLS